MARSDDRPAHRPVRVMSGHPRIKKLAQNLQGGKGLTRLNLSIGQGVTVRILRELNLEFRNRLANKDVFTAYKHQSLPHRVSKTFLEDTPQQNKE